MATLAANASPEEIFEEIAFQNVLLESLDAGADDHGERRQEIEDTIAGLEARLPAEDGQEQNNDDTAIPEDVTWTGDEPWPFDHWTEEENGLAGWSNTEVYDAAPPANVTPTESGGSSSASSFQTSSLKRPHDTLNLTPDSEALSRSKRPTPNLSRSGTPSSLSSLDVGSLQVQARRQNSYATETARRRQLMAERAAQRRRERERTDAEFAALLSQRSPEPAPTAGPSRAAPDINTLPGPFDNWVDPDSSTWHSTAETLAPVFTRIKAERQRSPSPAPQRSSSVANWPTQVVDLTGSDDEDDVVPYNQVPLPDHPQPFIPPPQNSHSVINNAYQRALAIGRSAFTTFGDYANPWSELENLLNPASSSHTPGRYESVYDPVAGMPQPGHVDWDSVLQNSETTKEDLLKLMDNVRPDEEIPVDMQPVKVEGLEVALKPYQAAGLKWLQDMDAGSNKGGILADDMGLGKTVQAIALMVTRRSEDPLRKTNLILAPVALLRQWKEEIMSKVRPGRHRLSVFIHHANSKAKSFSELRNYDVVLTTFGTIASELKRHDRYQARKKADPEAVERADEKTIFISQNSKFFRIIIDEAQCIKNKSTQTAQAVYLLQARSRFCMTGTPMMNSVDELQSLIRFIRIKPYSDFTKFTRDFSRPLKGSNDSSRDAAMQKLQVLLKAILLRRTKQSKINGQPILQLPERSVEMATSEFSEDERGIYSGLETQTAITFNRYLKAGTVGKQYAHMLVLLLRLRQACCHPHLIKDFGVAAAADITPEAMEDIAKNLDEAIVARLKELDGFECPVCYDAVENPAIFAQCGHFTCSECFSRIADSADALANGDEHSNTKCPTCRAPIKTKEVIDYETFKRVHMPDTSAEGLATLADAIDPDATDSEAETESDTDDEEDSDDDETESLDGFIVNDDEETASETEVEDDVKAENGVKSERGQDGDGTSNEQTDEAPMSAKKKGKQRATDESTKKSKKSKKAKGKGKSRKGKEHEKPKKKKKENVNLADLKKRASRNAAAKREYLSWLREDFISSSKIDRTLEIIEAVPKEEKIIIFSQWTSLLDLLEIPVDERGWGYRRYDGSMNAKMRGDAVEDFKTKPSVRMMLVSLKAGNAGLNLNCASQVIILDPFWNPYIEEQAIDRAHRLGQTRPVKVHRVLVENTVEDRIIALQEKKRAIIESALDEKGAQRVGRLNVQELAYLFGVTRGPNERLPAAGTSAGRAGRG